MTTRASKLYNYLSKHEKMIIVSSMNSQKLDVHDKNTVKTHTSTNLATTTCKQQAKVVKMKTLP